MEEIPKNSWQRLDESGTGRALLAADFTMGFVASLPSLACRVKPRLRDGDERLKSKPESAIWARLKSARQPFRCYRRERFLIIIICAAVLFGARAGLAADRRITVAADGSGDFKTVQEAITAVPDRSAERTVIHIKPGTYQGQILLPAEKSKVTFEGADLTNTVLTYGLNQNEPVPPGQSDKYKGAAVVILGDDFRAENLTFQNTSGDHGQAMALRTYGDRAIIRHCRLLGWQDTLLVSTGRQYFRDCYLEGRVDFIYGAATVVFDRCEIHSKNGGYVTAASTPQNQPFGFVFLNCRLTGEGKEAFLGRPWRPFGSVVYLNCEMGAHIKPEGWDNWRNAENEKTARYAEYGSTGPGANPSKRTAWSKQLSKEEAERITLSAVLGGKDHWKPEE